MITFIGDGGHAKVCRTVSGLGWYEHSESEWHFIAIGNNHSRMKSAREDRLYAQLIHKSAIVADGVTVGAGTVIMAGAIVQPGSRIGKHVIINTAATVDHDCIIGDYAHIAPGAHLCGGVVVGDGALVGVGVGIEPGVIIPAWSTVKRPPYVIAISGH